MHCPGGNTIDPIWRVLASFDGISSWTPLKPQHSNPNHNPNLSANQLQCIDLLTPPTPLIIPHRLPAFLESLMPQKNRCSIYARWSKSSLKHSLRSFGIFPSLKQNFIAYRSSKVSDWIFLKLLCFDLLTRPKMPFRVMHRKEVTHTQTLSNPFRNLTNNLRGKIFYKEVFLRLSVCVVYSCDFIIVRLFNYLLCRYDAAWTSICVYKHIYYVSI